jgi:hypothetical protein
MTRGSRSSGGSTRFAILAIVAISGCHAMPLDRVEGGPNRSQSLAKASRATLLPATVAMEPPAEMSSIEPVLTAQANLTPVDPSAPTPLLDAALQKVKNLDQPPVPAPDPISPSPSPTSGPEPAPPSAMFTAPLPIELPNVVPAKAEPVALAVNPTTAEPPRKEPEPARPEDLWRDGVRKLNSLARVKVEQSGGSASPWGLRSRILAWLAEPDINPEIDPHETEGVRTVLRALDDPPSDASRKGDVVRSAVLVLEDKAPLELADLKLCYRVDGFGDYKPFEPPVRKAGQEVIIYCEIDGLRFEQTSNGFRTRLAGQLEFFSESGGPPVLVKSLGTAEEICRKRRRDYYVVYKIVLPKPLSPGEYRMKLTEKDLNSDHSATRELTFFVAND